jgi:hypothetical protein
MNGFLSKGTNMTYLGRENGIPDLVSRLQEAVPVKIRYQHDVQSTPDVTLVRFWLNEVPSRASQAWLKRVVNIFGDNPDSALRMEHGDLIWVLSTREDTSQVMLTLYNTHLWPSQHNDTLIALIKLGLETVPVTHVPPVLTDMGQLLRMYSSLASVKADYIAWQSTVYQQKLGEPKVTCDPELHKNWLCCAQHMLLHAQRNSFYEWFKYLFENRSQYTKPNYDIVLSYDIPTRSEQLGYLAKYIHPWNTVTEYLALGDLDWGRKIETLRDQTVNCSSWEAWCARHCCELHRACNAIGHSLQHWAAHLDRKNNITRFPSQAGSTPNLGAGEWLALLIHTEGIDPKSLELPEWLDEEKYKDILAKYGISS